MKNKYCHTKRCIMRNKSSCIINEYCIIRYTFLCIKKCLLLLYTLYYTMINK